MPRFLLKCCVMLFRACVVVIILFVAVAVVFFCKLFGQTIANCAALEIWSMQPLRAQEIQIAPLNTSTLSSLLLSFYKYVNKPTYRQRYMYVGVYVCIHIYLCISVCGDIYTYIHSSIYFYVSSLNRKETSNKTLGACSRLTATL